MNILKRLFRTVKNPMLLKLEEAIDIECREVFYFSGFVYSDENYLNFKIYLERDSLEEVKNKLHFDVTKDNLEIYFVTTVNEEKYIIVLIDKFEPLQKERVLEKILIDSFPSIKMEKLK